MRAFLPEETSPLTQDNQHSLLKDVRIMKSCNKLILHNVS
jgi:hypothetical protein